ncbi:MAG: aminotransferase class V-fold PLP-dependent enzyme [Bacteroidia bacterium]
MIHSLFDLEDNERHEITDHLFRKLDQYYTHTHLLPVAPVLNQKEIRDAVRKFDFNEVKDRQESLDAIVEALEKYTVHISHPAYFGLFNPRANYAGILADLISAVFNIQMAAWSHAPFAAEAETWLVEQFGLKFGYAPESVDGVFCTGGAEANQTALLCALNHQIPDFGENGLAGMEKKPVIYCSAQSHHSLIKAARTAGVGASAVRAIGVLPDLRMDTAELESAIQADLSQGFLPVMVAGTAGTTGPGAIDDLPAIAAICRKYHLWFHVDAAYGGAVVLHPEYRHWIRGIEESHSITFDIHKWLSVPMSCSLFLTKETQILKKTFSIETGYMPRDARGLEITDPFTHSIQWSRRFIGFKLFLSLVFYGWKGYADTIEYQVKMGDLLKEKLVRAGWKINNHSRLPIVCFTDKNHENDANFAPAICNYVVKSGKAWISVFPIDTRPALRACITNYATTEKEIDELILLLAEAKTAAGYQP